MSSSGLTFAALPQRVLKDRVVLVTGAHGGLGAAASVACAQAGAMVVMLGRKVPKLNRVYDAVAATGREPVLYPLDLEGASADDYAQMAERIQTELGRLDGVLHCAAQFSGLTPLAQTDPAAFARALHINLTARWWLSQACLPLLSRASDAALVFAMDDPARVSGPYWGAYGLAQSAQAAMVAMLQAELAQSSIRVSGLQPGPMRTALRARAFVEEADGGASDPAAYAQACVTLLSTAGAPHRGQVWAPAPVAG